MVLRWSVGDWPIGKTSMRYSCLNSICISRSHVSSWGSEEGLKAVDEGLERAVEFEERAACAELHRIRGELLAASGVRPADEVESCFRDALDIAREQQAKTFELRAATSLARLWASRGDRQRAHDLLAPIYGSFGDFNTRDLSEAKVLLSTVG